MRRISPYLKHRGLLTSLPAGFACGVAAFYVRNVELPIFSLAGSSGQSLSLLLMLPLVVAVVAISPLARTDQRLETVALRRLEYRDLAILGATCFAFTLAILLSMLITGHGELFNGALAAARNLLALIAAYLFARIVADSLAASVLMCAYAFACFVAGSRNNVPFWWAILVHDETAKIPWFITGFALALAALLFCARIRLRGPWHF